MASIQEMVRPGDALDVYYYSGETSKKQAFPTTVNTKYVQNFNNLTGGANTFLFPPQCGLQDIVVTMRMPSITSNAGLALPSGWAYGLVKSCSFRYAGTSQFLLSGDQLLQNALRDQTSRASCDDLINIGGNYASGADLLTPQVASIVLRLPHASASGVNKALPFPTDCLTQQVQIILELNNISEIWTNTTGSDLPTACRSLAFAQFQCQQIMFNNMGDSLARRVDLSSKAYAFPCEFVQQKITVGNNLLEQGSIVLSGFRAGSCKNIQIYLTRNDDNLPSYSRGGNPYNPNKWYAPLSVEMVYAGDIYARYDNGVGQLFNLINSNKASAFDIAEVVTDEVSVSTPKPFLSQWLELPFSQPLCDEDSHYILMHGRAITNGIINLNNLVLPNVSAPSGWTLNVSYVYNATLLFSQGSVDYVF